MFAYRLAPGHITLSALLASSSYLLTNFAQQADQDISSPWAIAGRPVIEEFALAETGLNGFEYGQGLPSLVLEITVLTPGMLAHWNTTFFSTGARSALATVLIPDMREAPNDQALGLQCVMTKPTPQELRQTLQRSQFYSRAPYRLTQCEVIV